MIGIYINRINYNTITNICWCSAINIKKRWNKHIYDLKHNVHHSIKLQRHCNKYGISD
jgi:hypothetical protein